VPAIVGTDIEYQVDVQRLEQHPQMGLNGRMMLCAPEKIIAEQIRYPDGYIHLAFFLY
jgi:hypothetical protein